MTRIAIDLNVRVRGSQTFAGFEDVQGAFPVVGETVEVYEPESGAYGKAQVTELDNDRRLVYLDVLWAGLVNPTVIPGGGILVDHSIQSLAAATTVPLDASALTDLSTLSGSYAGARPAAV